MQKKKNIFDLYDNEKCYIYKNFQCKKCRFPYELSKGKCVADYSFRAIYNSSFKNENIKIINKIYEKIIRNLIIDDKPKIPSSTYNFRNPGMHEVLISLNLDLIFSTSNMFSNITNLIFLEIKGFSISNNIMYAKEMFKNCINLKTMIFENIIYKNVNDLSYMFENCFSLSSLVLPIFSSNKLRNISFMFSNCTSLKYIEFPFINTISTKDMSGLFYGCSSLTSINLSGFNTQNLKNISYMFAGCVLLKEINIEFFETKKITYLNHLFYNCSNLKSVRLPFLNSQQLKNINDTFVGCNQLSSSNVKFKEIKSKKINDICIVGPWYGRNYGSMLTYYALHEAIKKMGYSILMINDPLETNNIIYTKFHPKTMTSHFYNVSKNKRLDELFELNKECKLFLTGSDQLWNVYLSRPLKQFYFLGFVDNITKKLSYGTSFGTKYKGTEEEKKITKFNLDRFDGISVRDEISVNVSKETFNIKNVIQVCDPTFLCDVSNYLKLAKKATIKKFEEYILAYILDPDQEIGYRLEKLSSDNNIKVIIILDYPPDILEDNKKKLFLKGKGKVEVKNTISINDWLWYYNNSKAVFTDSFHGTIFSIIFKKPFKTLRNIKRGGERFFSLLKPLKLINRLFEKPDCINERFDLYEKINYTVPIELLEQIKKKSFNWLINKLHFLIK